MRLWDVVGMINHSSKVSGRHEKQYRRAKELLDSLGQTRRMTERGAHGRLVPRPLFTMNHQSIIRTENPFLDEKDRKIISELQKHIPFGGNEPQKPSLTVYEAKAMLKPLSEDARVMLHSACAEYARQESLKVVHLPSRPKGPPCYVPVCLSCGLLGLLPVGADDQSSGAPAKLSQQQRTPPRVFVSTGNGKASVRCLCMYCEGLEMAMFDVSRSVLYCFLELKNNTPVPVSSCPSCKRCFILDYKNTIGVEPVCVICYKAVKERQSEVHKCFMGHSMGFHSNKESIRFTATNNDGALQTYYACDVHIHPSITKLGNYASINTHRLCVIALNDTRTCADIENKICE